jgi:3-deoxy-manno-octulosonate cytidylyltransferase (CMP-KDO synthetase)
MDNLLIIIPARLQATRLPNKPLAMIGDKPMIVHVAENAAKASIGKVIVACGEQEIMDVVTKYGFDAILTDTNLPTGTDRVNAAANIFDPQRKYEYIINLQGDLPFVQSDMIRKTYQTLINNNDCDIATIMTEIIKDKDINNPNIVKIAVTENNRALYFSRTPIPYNAHKYYYHIGLYGFKRESLQKFISLPQGILEISESLEQLRALENNMKIYVGEVDAIPMSVDTNEDLEKIRRYYAKETI